MHAMKTNPDNLYAKLPCQVLHVLSAAIMLPHFFPRGVEQRRAQRPFISNAVNRCETLFFFRGCIAIFMLVFFSLTLLVVTTILT